MTIPFGYTSIDVLNSRMFCSCFYFEAYFETICRSLVISSDAPIQQRNEGSGMSAKSL